MKRILISCCFALLAVPAFAAETGAVVETFGCKLKEGKTMADFDSATKFWQKTAAGVAALDGYFAALLVPYRANTDYDVVWVGVDANLNSWARSDAPYMAAGGVAAEERFAAAADCESGLYFSTDLHDALAAEDGDDDAVVETYACKLREGRSLADLAIPHAAFAAANKAIATADATLTKFLFVQWTPYLSNTPYDVLYLTVNDDLESFAKDATAYLGSAEGQAAEAAWGRVVDCESGLWRSRVIHEPKAAE